MDRLPYNASPASSPSSLLVQLLVRSDYIHHVVDEHHFEDTYLFFRFRQDGEFCVLSHIRPALLSLSATATGTLVFVA